MANIKDSALDSTTKKAWEENWSDISVEKILGIFSYVRVKKQMEIFLRYLPKDQKIFEGGCGLGPYLIRLRQLGYDVIGGDYNLPPLLKIKQYDANIPVICADVLNTPFRDGSFGAYMSLGVIEHFTEGPEGAIREGHRILKDSGIFIIQIPINNALRILRQPIEALKRNALVRKILKKPEKIYYWEQYIPPKKLISMVKKNGFDVLSAVPIDHTHNLCTFCGPLFRDKNTYDEANALGIRMGDFLEKVLPWSTAAQAIFICKKTS
jgi:SAM-dependent methyltransferase